MTKRKIADMDQLKTAAAGTLAKYLSNKHEYLVSNIVQVDFADTEVRGGTAVEGEEKGGSWNMLDKLEDTMLAIANITLSTSNKNGRVEILLKEKDEALVSGLKRDISYAAKLDINLDEDAVEKTKEELQGCLTKLEAVREKYTKKIEDIKRDRLCRRATGAFFASLTGLGLMEFWVKRKAEALLSPKWMTGVTCGLYACMAVSSAVLAHKYIAALKDKFQAGHQDKDPKAYSLRQK